MSLKNIALLFQHTVIVLNRIWTAPPNHTWSCMSMYAFSLAKGDHILIFFFKKKKKRTLVSATTVLITYLVFLILLSSAPLGCTRSSVECPPSHSITDSSLKITPSWAPLLVISTWASLLQLFLGRASLVPRGLYFTAGCVMCVAGFLRVCPIQIHSPPGLLSPSDLLISYSVSWPDVICSS